MIDSTTQLNTPGTQLGTIDGVHALTDVTGFGLLGHLLEIAQGLRRRGTRRLDARAAAARRARARARGHRHRRLGAQLGRLRRARRRSATASAKREKALLTDPQTSGGLLVACAPEAVDEVLAIFRAEGFGEAAVIGEIAAGRAATWRSN